MAATRGYFARLDTYPAFAGMTRRTGQFELRRQFGANEPIQADIFLRGLEYELAMLAIIRWYH